MRGVRAGEGKTGRAGYFRQWKAAHATNHWVLMPRKKAVWSTIMGITVRLNLAARAVFKS